MYYPLLIVVAVMIFMYTKTPRRLGYDPRLPTSMHHPCSFTEVAATETAIARRTDTDVRAHYLTDRSVLPMFIHTLEKNDVTLSEEEIDQLHSTISHPRVADFIMGMKNRYNRARPWQIKKLDGLPSVTAHTPSFPAGHAYQAWMLYIILSKTYPTLDPELYVTAQYCDDIRVMAGLHYPSDGEYSKQLAFSTLGTPKRNENALQEKKASFT